MEPPGADVVLVRHGDIGVKSARVQTRMERRLRENLQAMLEFRGVDGEVEREWGRLFVRTETPSEAAAAATDVFGVVSASPARSVVPDLDAIADVLAETARGAYMGGTFAVDARRTGEQQFTSHDVGRVGGDAIWRTVEDDFEPEVDLDNPDVRFSVEVRESEAYVFLDTIDGTGGLPVGSQKPLVALVSGGIDSPVAAWLAMKRGTPIVPLYLDLGGYGGADHRARAMATIETLTEFAPNQQWRVRVVPIGTCLKRIEQQVQSTRMLTVRRLMYLIAERLAEETGAIGIVTGEAIGQKSSQTAANLHVTDRVTQVPIHRPLLTYDKQEIISIARRIGTFEDATIQAGCNRIAPNNPDTRASISRVEEREPDELAEWADEAVERVEVVDLQATNEAKTAVEGSE